MHRNVRALCLVTGGILAVSASCIDATRLPTGVSAADQKLHGAGGRLLGTRLVVPAKRLTPLEEDVSWTFTAGPSGAISRNDALGLTIRIPPGALTTTETVTVTALAGSHVAYRFEPHLEFGRSVSLEHDIAVLRPLSLLRLVGGHFEGSSLQISNGFAAVTESVPASISILAGTIRLDVEHFSGWIVASGYEEPPPDSSSGSIQ
jgi:hypothetical protein